jgi:CheY-like chemotaxis protein
MPASILVIEDDADAREILHLLLTEQGFIIKVAEDGYEALKLTESMHPDLIITDLQMPNLDGIGLIKELRKRPEMRDVPILIFSASSNQFLSDAIRAGANAAAPKPLQLIPFIRLVKSLITEVTFILLSIFAARIT